MKKNTIFCHIQRISQFLNVEYTDLELCQQYAWWLLEKICQKTKTELIVHNFFELTEQQSVTLHSWIMDIVFKSKPIQYILGSVSFNGLDILVEPPTLIPRPETEEWCWRLIGQLKKLKNQKITILDLATGSGCIGLCLAYYLPEAHIVATDISAHALALAEKNRIHNEITNITFISSDLFADLSLSVKFDLIVTNPPYIAESERDMLDASVIEWEDHKALFSSDNGLAIIKQIISTAACYIQPNQEMNAKRIPQIIIEIGYAQAIGVKQFMLEAGYSDVYIQKDLGNKDRCVVGRIDNVANSNP